MLRQVRYILFYLKNIQSNRVKIQRWTNNLKYVSNVIPLHLYKCCCVATLITCWWCTNSIAKMKLSVTLYVQCDFVDIGALERGMLRHVCCILFYLKSIKSNRVKIIQSWTTIGNMSNLIPLHFYELCWVTISITCWWSTKTITKMQLSGRFWKARRTYKEQQALLWGVLTCRRCGMRPRSVCWSGTARWHKRAPSDA